MGYKELLKKRLEHILFIFRIFEIHLKRNPSDNLLLCLYEEYLKKYLQLLSEYIQVLECEEN